MTAREVSRLAARLAGIERQVSSLSAPRLAHSSIVDGAVDQVETVDTGDIDELGNPVFREQLVSRYGRQPDGSNTLVVLDGPQPPRPVAPTVTGGPGFLAVAWNGQFEDREEPYLDHDYVAVHASQTEGFVPHAGTLVASIRSTVGESLAVPISEGTWHVSLVAVAQSGRWSEPAPYTEGEPGTASGVDVTAREMAAAAQSAADVAARRAAESRALADEVSAAANLADNRAIEALMFGTTSFLSADGKTRVTYSLDPPNGAGGSVGDTWFQIDRSGVVVGFWECTDGDAETAVPEPVTVTPAEPVYTDTDVTIPATAGVTYLMGGRPVAAGTYTSVGAVAVVATADAGHRIVSGARTAWVGTVDEGQAAPPDVEVTPEAPTFTDVPGTAADKIVIPDVEGVTYWSGTVELGAGEHPGSGQVTVTASPQPGFVFPQGSVVSWSWSFAATRVEVTPESPVFVDEDGTVNDAVRIPAVEGVQYRVDGVSVPAGDHPASGAVTVTAVAAGDGWRIASGAPTSWSWTFDPLAYVSPAGPTWRASSYSIPAETGVAYSIDGTVIDAGEYAVSTGTGVLSTTTFDAGEGAPWPAPWVRGWGSNDGCVADVRYSRGRMRVQGGGSWADKLFVRAQAQRADVDMTYQVAMNQSGDTWHHTILRSQQPSVEPQNGYDVLFNRGDVRIMRVESWSGATIGQSTARGMPLGKTSWVRVRHVGPTISVKLWDDGQPEPVEWLVEASDTRWSSGYYGFLMVGGRDASGYEHHLDDLVVRDPAGAGAVTVTVDASATAGWTLAKGAPSRWTRTYGG